MANREATAPGLASCRACARLSSPQAPIRAYAAWDEVGSGALGAHGLVVAAVVVVAAMVVVVVAAIVVRGGVAGGGAVDVLLVLLVRVPGPHPPASAAMATNAGRVTVFAASNLR